MAKKEAIVSQARLHNGGAIITVEVIGTGEAEVESVLRMMAGSSLRYCRAVGTAQAAQAMAWALFTIRHLNFFEHAQFQVYNITNRVFMATLKLGANSSMSYPPIAEKPLQPVAFNFPKREYGKQVVIKRSFQAAWFAKWMWLQYTTRKVMTPSFFIRV